MGNMIESLSRELHPPHTNLVAETEVCPWTLFLTMSLTLLKGLMPHVPQMLPFLISDPEMRSRAEETFLSPEFQENIEEYFVNNIKSQNIYRQTLQRVFFLFQDNYRYCTICCLH